MVLSAKPGIPKRLFHKKRFTLPFVACFAGIIGILFLRFLRLFSDSNQLVALYLLVIFIAFFCKYLDNDTSSGL